MVKTFGRANDNSNIINKADIGRNHARITLLENGYFFVEDLNSTNGVYINGYRVSQANVTLKDEVRLSESTVLNLASIFGLNTSKPPTPQQPSAPNNFSEEFKELKKVWIDYNFTKNDISIKSNRNSKIIQACVSLAPFTIYFIYSSTHPSNGNNMLYTTFSVIGGVIGNLSVGFLMPSPAVKLNLLDEEFRVRYVCPNPDCRNQLGNIPWHFCPERPSP